MHEHKYLGDIEVTTIGSVKRMRFIVREPEQGAPQQIPFVIRQGHTMQTYLFTEVCLVILNYIYILYKTYTPQQHKNETTNRYDPSNTQSLSTYKMEDSIRGHAEIKPEDTPEYQQFLLHKLQQQQVSMMEKNTSPAFRDDIDIFGTISIQQVCNLFYNII